MSNILLDELSKAIGARLYVQFRYGDQTYTVEPHLLGQNKTKQDCLCGWSIENSVVPSSNIGWHCFLLDNVKGLKVMDKRFTKVRPGYDPYDNTMNRIYYRV